MRSRPTVQRAAGAANAGADRDSLAFDRADRGEPQLLQRPAGVRLHRRLGLGWPPPSIHRLASNALRRAPAWDCGFPDPDPATQYTAESFAQPIRRVFGGFAFRARERVDMPAPGDMRPARLTRRDARSRLGSGSTRRSSRRSTGSRAGLNALQFLTIRQYLSVVFGALVYAPAGAWRHGRDRSTSSSRLAQMLLVLALAPLPDGLRAQGQGAAAAPARPAAAAALSRSRPARAQGGGGRRERVLALPRSFPISCSPRPGSPPRWSRPSRPDLLFSWSADLIAIVALLGGARFFLAPRRHGRGDELRRHRLEPRGDVRDARRAGDDHDRVLRSR